MYFLSSFSKFLRYFTKILYSNTSISKIIAADLNVLRYYHWVILPQLKPIRPSRPHYDFYDFI